MADSPEDKERPRDADANVDSVSKKADESAAVPEKKPAVDPRASGPLAPAWAALERGDHVEAASIARGLAKSDDEATRNDADAFLQRLKPDPVILMVFAGTGLLILLLAWQYLGHRH